MEKLRFDAEPIFLDSLRDEILAVCPSCEKRVQIVPSGASDARFGASFQPRRATCLACGFSKEWRGRKLAFDSRADPMREPYFDLPLWLQTLCAGRILWAYNTRHLDLLENYVRAEHRQTPVNSTRMIPDALPEWMIVAKHRDEVLRGIEKLRSRL